MRFGYKLSSEERSASDLVADAVGAEAAGFDVVAISDHFHPWIDAEGQSPFVWTTLGAVAERTERIEVTTAVTCPTIRIHPAIVAQAAATVATLMPGRFVLGVGTGERLNEHITGAAWPDPATRRDMLEEAVAAIRELFDGGMVTFRGDHVTVERARLYSLPDEPVPIHVAASGEAAATLAARIGDGLISTGPISDVAETYRREGGAGPCSAELTVCVGREPEEALGLVAETWPLSGVGGELSTELALPSDFAAVGELVGPDRLRGSVTVGEDVDDHLVAVREFADAGFDHVWFHQVGQDQERFLSFAGSDLLPALRESFGSAAA